MNAKCANNGAVACKYIHTFGSLCVRVGVCVCVCKNSETKYPFAWLLTNKKRNNVERTDENDQRVLAASAAAAARKAEFVAAAKRTLCRTALNRGAPRGPA